MRDGMSKIETAVIAGAFALLMALALTAYAGIAQVQSTAAAAASAAPTAVQPDPPAAAVPHHAIRSGRYHPRHHKAHARHPSDREQRMDREQR